MKIADIEMHEHYKDESPFYNDIAVIKTSDEVIAPSLYRNETQFPFASPFQPMG